MKFIFLALLSQILQKDKRIRLKIHLFKNRMLSPIVFVKPLKLNGYQIIKRI